MKKMIGLLAILFLSGANAAHACPGCTELMSSGADAFKAMLYGKGIAWSMLLMFVMPVSLVGAMVFMIVRASKRANARQNLECGPKS